MQKAQGIKIKDNPSLLKKVILNIISKALKNKEKQKQKNRENWKNKLEEIENVYQSIDISRKKMKRNKKLK